WGSVEQYEHGLRYELLRAFGALGPAAMGAVPELMAGFVRTSMDYDTTEVAVEVLVGLGPGVVGPMLDQAEHVEPDDIRDAVEVFVKIGPAVIPLLLDALADAERDGAAKEVAALALADEGLIEHLGGDAAQAVLLLAAGLKHEDEYFRRQAAGPLGELREAARAAIPPLRGALPDGAVRESAAPAPARAGGGTPGVDPLAAERSSAAAERRVAAVRALDELDDEAARPMLLQALGDPDLEVRRRAAQAVAEQVRPPWAEAIAPLRRAVRDED